MMWQSMAGFLLFAGIAWLFSENRAKVAWPSVAAGMGVQLVLALVLLKVPGFREFFMLLNDGVMALEQATSKGTAFVFGYLGG